MTDKRPAAVGMVGLGVMGSSLALNLTDHGVDVVAFSIDKSERARAVEDNLRVLESIPDLLAALPEQKVIFLMITAGEPVDQILQQLLDLLSPGDVVVDGGNSLFSDTERRVKTCQNKGVSFIGTGISGGEQGARHGASIMVGGARSDFEQIRHVFAAIACDVRGEPCFGWMGQGGAGHFVKMVHNGIEYGVMQLIAETYDFCRRGLGLSVEQTRAWFVQQQNGPLDSYLMEITAAILAKPDELDAGLLIDKVSDVAGQKGTGRWCVDAAMSLGVPVPSIIAAVTERQLSGSDELRQVLASRVAREQNAEHAWDLWRQDLSDCLLGGVLATFAQGLALIHAASKTYAWETDLRAAVRLWRGGCIIRAALLEEILAVGDSLTQLDNLLLAPSMSEAVLRCTPGWRRMAAAALSAGVPVPATTASLAYVDSLYSERLPTHLIQAQRDCFGAHTFARTDRPGVFHVDWMDHGR